MEIPDAVLVIIGRQQVQIDLLRGQLSQTQKARDAAMTVRCPDPSAHQEGEHVEDGD